MLKPITPSRRLFVRSSFALALASLTYAMPGVASAQAYPSQPIQVVVPFPAGGIVDNVTRKLGTQLNTALGQPIIIENRAGAGGSIGAAQVARASQMATPFCQRLTRMRSTHCSTS